MKRIILLIIIVSVIAIFGCGGKSTDDEGNSALGGLVNDSLTQIPIDSVAIYLNDTIGQSNLYTDSLGLFGSVVWGGGVRTIFAKKTGYHTKWQQINLDNNPTDILFELVKQ